MLAAIYLLSLTSSSSIFLPKKTTVFAGLMTASIMENQYCGPCGVVPICLIAVTSGKKNKRRENEELKKNSVSLKGKEGTLSLFISSFRFFGFAVIAFVVVIVVFVTYS